MAKAAKIVKTAQSVKSATHNSQQAARTVVRAALWTGALVGAVALANAVVFYRTPPLATAIDEGDVRYYPTTQGDVFYQRAGSGPTPLLLVHAIGAGESSFEFRRVFAALAATGTHTVYAIDLPGFGKSDKPDIEYAAKTYRDLIAAFARDVIAGKDGNSRPIDVIATSLSAAYAAATAYAEPSLFGRLVLVGPTGMEELVAPPTPVSVATRGLLRLPVLGTALYNAITSKASLGWYLRNRIYRDPEAVTDAIVDQYHTAAHQPGGDRVLPSFVTRGLNQSVQPTFGRLTQPILLVWGDEARTSPVGRADAFLDANPGARLTTIPDAGDLPHDEQPEAFLHAVHSFLA